MFASFENGIWTESMSALYSGQSVGKSWYRNRWFIRWKVIIRNRKKTQIMTEFFRIDNCNSLNITAKSDFNCGLNQSLIEMRITWCAPPSDAGKMNKVRSCKFHKRKSRPIMHFNIGLYHICVTFTCRQQQNFRWVMLSSS